jgi:SAM-dependent methyltransferase
MSTTVVSRNQSTSTPTLSTFLLSKFCRPVDSVEYAAGSTRLTVANSLDFLLKSTPGFLDLVRGRKVLDFGCGMGMQSAALAKHHGCDVTGVDLDRPVVRKGWERMRLVAPSVKFTTDLQNERFDVVFSCSAFEHFDDPKAILDLMIDRCAPGGRIIISFAEPWYSPRGSHMDGFCRLPWLNVLFPESAIMAVRSRYRDDGATRYEDVEGGLNRMTVARFERLMRESGCEIESLRLIPVRGLPLVSRIPVLRELFTASASCVLRKPL